MRRSLTLTNGVTALALLAAGFAAWSVLQPRDIHGTVALPAGIVPLPPAQPVVAGTGMIEPSSNFVNVAARQSGIVTEVDVEPGQEVAQGAPLFKVDDERFAAQLAYATADEAGARAVLAADDARLILQRAMVDQAMADTEGAQAEMRRSELDNTRYATLGASQTSSAQRVETAAADMRKAAAQVHRSQATLDAARYQATVLAAQRQEAQARLEEAAAATANARIDLDRATTRAPFAGTVLQVNVRAGQAVQPSAGGQTLIVFGAMQELTVRVSIDEADAYRVRRGEPATAYLRGDSRLSAPLTFLRFEPYVVPKDSIPSLDDTRVDTRVLQILYRLAPGDLPVFVGQQVDVLIHTSNPVTAANDARKP